jgi:flagellar biosynthetic protein FlhB
MADKSQKTEKPTPHRLKKAREEGRFPSAREFVSAAQFAAFVAWLGYAGSEWLDQLRIEFRILLGYAFRSNITVEGLTSLLFAVVERSLMPLAGLAGTLLGSTLLLQLITTNFGFSTKRLMPDFKRVNPISKLKDLTRQNIPGLVQALILLPAFGYIVYVIVKTHLVEFYNLPGQSFTAAFHVVTASLNDLLWKAAGGFLVFGLVNMLRQRRQYEGDLKMSRQEIKDEHKQNEGSPQIKSRVRRLQRDLRRRSMMKDVAKATAVIVNPTHYAVAIRYQMPSMAAPTVLAKGKNYLAQRIRQRANDHNIPIIENPPLARALYKSAEIGQEIPPHLFKAVAEVLAYIFRIMKGRLPGQDDL